MTDDLFGAFAEANKPAHERRKEAAAAKRRLTAKEKEKERHELSKSYRLHRRKAINTFLEDDVFGSRATELLKFLRRMTIQDGPELLRQMSAPWLVHAPFEIRWEALRMASHNIVRARLAADLPEFDDGMPDEEPGMLHKIKDALGMWSS